MAMDRVRIRGEMKGQKGCCHFANRSTSGRPLALEENSGHNNNNNNNNKMKTEKKTGETICVCLCVCVELGENTRKNRREDVNGSIATKRFKDRSSNGACGLTAIMLSLLQRTITTLHSSGCSTHTQTDGQTHTA